MSNAKIEELVKLIRHDKHFGARNKINELYVIDNPKVPNGFIMEKMVPEKGWKPFGDTPRATIKEALGQFTVEFDEGKQLATIEATDDVKAKIVSALGDETVKKINESTDNSLPEKPGFQPPPLFTHV